MRASRAGWRGPRTPPGCRTCGSPSGAGHDAALFANAGIPTGMIFVRNQNGSHNPQEAMRTDDFMAGCELLWRLVVDFEEDARE